MPGGGVQEHRLPKVLKRNSTVLNRKPTFKIKNHSIKTLRTVSLTGVGDADQDLLQFPHQRFHQLNPQRNKKACSLTPLIEMQELSAQNGRRLSGPAGTFAIH
ncbi:hypothetical protein AVEN_107659-1 [Araneus ventricosus]|uniref:Uncharacterized protein n=1 Tax=Araneus ventricosus TaxID=182803 RepID=A0A4Y2Q7N4_ARAVE|nr:hypothetical protein AVEN_107659-1 [Araneus ventricosus]